MWTLIEPHTIGDKGTWGGNAKDTRIFIKAVFWVCVLALRGVIFRRIVAKRGLNTKIHLAADANGMPVRVLVTAGITVDCKQAIALIEDFAVDFLLVD